MKVNNTQKILLGILIVLGIVTIFVARQHSKSFLTQTDSNIASTTSSSQATTTKKTRSASTTTTSLPGGLKITGTSGYTVTQVPINSRNNTAQPIPSLSRPVTFGNVTLSADQRQLVTSKIIALQAFLSKNPADLPAWIELGIYQKMAGDYNGAVITWKYAAHIAPTDYISVGDLADLYAYYIHDNVQAEIYYNTALSRGPLQSYLYVQFATYYRDVVKDQMKAKVIIDRGLSKLPQDKSLLEFNATLN